MLKKFVALDNQVCSHKSQRSHLILNNSRPTVLHPSVKLQRSKTNNIEKARIHHQNPYSTNPIHSLKKTPHFAPTISTNPSSPPNSPLQKTIQQDTLRTCNKNRNEAPTIKQTQTSSPQYSPSRTRHTFHIQLPPEPLFHSSPRAHTHTHIQNQPPSPLQ